MLLHAAGVSQMVEGYYLDELESKIELLDWQRKGRQYTASGYGSRIPTAHKVRLPGDNRWLRVYCSIWSNIGTCYVLRNSERIIIR
jgi:hypothetical protein